MPVMQLVNGDATTTSVNAQTAADAVITPQNWAGFPTAPQFTIRNGRTGELLLVTAVTTGVPNTWTVTRGFGGSAAAAINAGDSLEFNLTREMLLGGFVSKLDEQSLAADTANGTITLTVPVGISGLCRNLRVQWSGIAIGVAGNTGIGMRFNGDSTVANYTASAHVYTDTIAQRFGPYGYSRCGWIGRVAAGGAASAYYLTTEMTIELTEAFAADRWKSWHCEERMANADQLTQYVMLGAGTWKSLAAISTIQIGLDDAQNGTFPSGTLGNGFRASLYGVP